MTSGIARPTQLTLLVQPFDDTPPLFLQVLARLLAVESPLPTSTIAGASPDHPVFRLTDTDRHHAFTTCRDILLLELLDRIGGVVVHATRGQLPQELLWLAYQAGIRNILILNEMGGFALDPAEIRMRTELHELGLPADDLPIVRVQSRAALTAPLDHHSLAPFREVLEHLRCWSGWGDACRERPFRMQIAEIASMKQFRFVGVHGVIIQGRIEPRTRVEISTASGLVQAFVQEIRRNHRQLRQAQTGETVHLILPGNLAPLLRPGQLIAVQGHLSQLTQFPALFFGESNRITWRDQLRVCVRESVRGAEEFANLDLTVRTSGGTFGSVVDAVVTEGTLIGHANRSFRVVSGSRRDAQGMILYPLLPDEA